MADEATDVQDDVGSESDVQDWRATLPEDMRAEKSLADVKDIVTLAKNYVNTKKLVGGSVRLPGDDASEEEVAEFYNKLGRPESPDKYSKLDKSSLPEGTEWNEELESSYYQWAHAAGLSDKQANAMLQKYNEFTQAHAKNQEQSGSIKMAEAAESLRKQLGSAYDQTVSMAKRFFKQNADEEVAEFVESSGLGNHPGFIKFVANIAKRTIADHSIDGFAGTENFGMTPSDAKAKIAEVRGDAKHPFNDEKSGDHARWVNEKMPELYKFAYPE